MEFFSSYKPAVYRCYAYGRVSRSDKEKARRERDESNSITNQENICQGGFHPKDEVHPINWKFLLCHL